MPHLIVQYSANLDAQSDIAGLCRKLSETLAAAGGIFLLGGIRVRAYPARHYAIADHHPANAFADMVLRIGAGRSDAEKTQIGTALMATAEQHFAAELKAPHFALSLEIVENAPAFSWKTNSIHPRLKTQTKHES